MGKRVSIIGYAVAFLLLWTGFASATSFETPFGQDITISDQNSASHREWYTDREDDEVEPGMAMNQKWDLEGMFVNDTFILSLVGGYDFKNGANSLMSGDIFVDVDGDAQFGDVHGAGGNHLVTDTFGYDYVFELDFDNNDYRLYELNGSSQTITSREKQNQGSNPWRFQDNGEELLGSGEFAYFEMNANLIGALGFQGDRHFAISGFDLNLIPAGFEQINLHFTMECGNDNLMGQTTAPVPEPATMLLLGTGLIGLAGISRRKRRKSA